MGRRQTDGEVRIPQAAADNEGRLRLGWSGDAPEEGGGRCVGRCVGRSSYARPEDGAALGRVGQIPEQGVGVGLSRIPLDGER